MILNVIISTECTFIVLDREQWRSPGVEEEQCMIGDVNLFLTDPDDSSKAELEVMIAGQTAVVLCLHGICEWKWDWCFLCLLDPKFRGKGLGTEVASMMMNYGESFNLLD